MKSLHNSNVLVIFGASGDLTARKLIPAIFDLYKTSLLPENFCMLGVGRTDYSTETYIEKAIRNNTYLKDFTNDQITEFARKIEYISLETTDPSSYPKLRSKLEEIDLKYQTNGNYLFYLSTPPSMYGIIAEGLAGARIHIQSEKIRRLIIEKPFGYDKKTACLLNDKLHQFFQEDQIYRIDHYLGKETVQNLLVTRFANSIFEPLWNRNFIHHVEITAAEQVGVEKRGSYYDHSGALRDMVQNHLLNLVSLVAMEPPVDLKADSIRNETIKVLKSIRRYSPEEITKYVIRGQYTDSKVRGQNYVGYRREEGINAESKTETYVAMKFFIDNWRWADVPFYIRTGKRLPTRVTEIVIHFKSSPHYLFGAHQYLIDKDNLLIFRIQPGEGIQLKFGMKIPGSGFHVRSVNMDFHYTDLADTYVPEAYERLILDAMIGDATLYSRSDAVEAAWDFIDPILEEWKKNDHIKVYGYPAGSWGPMNADDLIEGKGLTWHYPTESLTGEGQYCEL